MIDSNTLEMIATEYLEQCEGKKEQPTYKGLSIALEVSAQTIHNVVTNSYNGKPYTKHPHATRCIDNSDFEVIQSIFAPRTE